MPNIGVVISGGMSKVAYEIGCLKAIQEVFGKENIRCISASSIGVLSGYALACDKLPEYAEMWRNLCDSDHTKSIIRISRDSTIIEKFKSFVADNDISDCEFYATLWNYSKRLAEYIPISKIDSQARTDYIHASVSLPIVNKGIKINQDTYFDGAFLDNIPVFPLIEKELDFIFCIYFDGWIYQFENEEFDRKVIKLNDFPEKSGMDFIIYDPKKVEQMITYGYDYTKKNIEQLFNSESQEDIYSNIASRNTNTKNRITTEVLLTQVNKAMSRLSKRKIN